MTLKDGTVKKHVYCGQHPNHNLSYHAYEGESYTVLKLM